MIRLWISMVLAGLLAVDTVQAQHQYGPAVRPKRVETLDLVVHPTRGRVQLPEASVEPSALAAGELPDDVTVPVGNIAVETNALYNGLTKVMQTNVYTVSVSWTYQTNTFIYYDASTNLVTNVVASVASVTASGGNLTSVQSVAGVATNIVSIHE